MGDIPTAFSGLIEIFISVALTEKLAGKLTHGLKIDLFLFMWLLFLLILYRVFRNGLSDVLAYIMRFFLKIRGEPLLELGVHVFGIIRNYFGIH